MLPIIIVDDSGEDIHLAVRTIQQCKILNPITTIASGEGAIRFFEGSGEYANRTLPCLLLLDLAMSPVSGVDVLARFKNHFESSSKMGGSVAVMLSGVQDLDLVNRGYKLGATTFLIKPLKCEDLIQLTTSIRGIAVERTSSGYILSLDQPDEEGT